VFKFARPEKMSRMSAVAARRLCSHAHGNSSGSGLSPLGLCAAFASQTAHANSKSVRVPTGELFSCLNCMRFMRSHKPNAAVAGVSILNTLSGRKEELTLVSGSSGLSWYTCGPTVYDAAHLGHARTYVSIDVMQVRSLVLRRMERARTPARRAFELMPIAAYPSVVLPCSARPVYGND
jgi:hypothetical protein